MIRYLSLNLLCLGEYFPLLGMEEDVRQKLVDDHFLFVSGDKVGFLLLLFIVQKPNKLKKLE